MMRSAVQSALWLRVSAIVLTGCDSDSSAPDAGAPDAGGAPPPLASVRYTASLSRHIDLAATAPALLTEVDRALTEYTDHFCDGQQGDGDSPCPVGFSASSVITTYGIAGDGTDRMPGGANTADFIAQNVGGATFVFLTEIARCGRERAVIGCTTRGRAGSVIEVDALIVVDREEPSVLVHELGHQLGLDHVRNCPASRFMCEGARGAQEATEEFIVTEAQCRAMLSGGSNIARFGDRTTVQEGFQCPAPVVCGDGVCDPDEGCFACAQDCGECCGDGVCDPLAGENCSSCPADCACVCGDGACDVSEPCDDCAVDCGACGVPDEACSNAGRAGFCASETFGTCDGNSVAGRCLAGYTCCIDHPCQFNDGRDGFCTASVECSMLGGDAEARHCPGGADIRCCSVDGRVNPANGDPCVAIDEAMDQRDGVCLAPGTCGGQGFPTDCVGGDVCCVAHPCTLNDGRQGACVGTVACDVLSGQWEAGYCPGGADVQCCVVP